MKFFYNKKIKITSIFWIIEPGNRIGTTGNEQSAGRVDGDRGERFGALDSGYFSGCKIVCILKETTEFQNFENFLFRKIDRSTF